MVRARPEIERTAERTGRAALAVTAESTADCLCIGPVLDGEGESNRRVTRVHVARGIALGVGQEQFANRAVRKPAATVQV